MITWTLFYQDATRWIPCSCHLYNPFFYNPLSYTSLNLPAMFDWSTSHWAIQWLGQLVTDIMCLCSSLSRVSASFHRHHVPPILLCSPLLCSAQSILVDTVYCVILYRIVPYCIVSRRIISYRTVLYRIAPYYIVSYRIKSYRTVSYCVVL